MDMKIPGDRHTLRGERGGADQQRERCHDERKNHRLALSSKHVRVRGSLVNLKTDPESGKPRRCHVTNAAELHAA